MCGCDNGTIKVYLNDSLLSEFFENSSVIQVSRIGEAGISLIILFAYFITIITHSDASSLLAYSLNDGTVGVYNEGVRLWRIKVFGKHCSKSGNSNRNDFI